MVRDPCTTMDPAVPFEQIAHYRLLSRLGAGGMGEVFLAEDTRLNRKVAIKRVRPDALDPQAHRRLLIEAQAAARLDHPNICGIHEVGQDDRGPYIVMPLVEGETLAARLTRGSLSIEESVSVAAQVADALAAAHMQGILHRDIKPANIMINARGQARVMDFGLAKFTQPDAASATAVETASALTTFGSTLGTAAYMSPEQARGEPVDARSDLFSLGIVIHEMVTGRRPFDGPSIADRVTAILTHEPLPLTRLRPETPDELQRIVSKLLRKNREERYQSAADLLVDLRAVLRQVQGTAPPVAVATPSVHSTAPPPSPPARRGWIRSVAGAVVVLVAVGAFEVWRHQRGSAPTSASTAMPHIESLAVLPLTNVSADPSQDYFAEAMTEELTRALSGIKSLRVISRTSTGQYKGSKRTMPEIANELHVDGIIEGSVVRDGDQVRITAQLIHGPTDRHLWANAYDGELRGMLALQRRVAEAIAQEVRATVTPEEQQTLRASRSIDPKAMDLYLKGRQLLYLGTSTSAGTSMATVEQAITTFTEALKIQRWAEACASLAKARGWIATGGTNPSVEFPASRELAVEAIRLDDRVADGHGALGYVSFAYDWDLATSEREFRRAIDLDPSSAYFMSYALLLEALGRFDEAKAMLDRAEQRDPLSAIINMEKVRVSLLARDYDETIRRAGLLPKSLGKDLPHLFIGQALLYQGRTTDAIAELEQAGPGFDARAALASALARAGRTAEAHTRLRELEGGVKTGSQSVDLAGVYVSLGEHARARDALERAYAGKASWLPLINVYQAFDELHGNPRFEDLLRRVGIPPRR